MTKMNCLTVHIRHSFISIQEENYMDPVTAMYVAQGIHGLAYGMVLFLIASGLTLIFGMMGILNLAHASFFMLSAYFCHQVLVSTGSFWLAGMSRSPSRLIRLRTSSVSAVTSCILSSMRNILKRMSLLERMPIRIF